MEIVFNKEIRRFSLFDIFSNKYDNIYQLIDKELGDVDAQYNKLSELIQTEDFHYINDIFDDEYGDNDFIILCKELGEYSDNSNKINKVYRNLTDKLYKDAVKYHKYEKPHGYLQNYQLNQFKVPYLDNYVTTVWDKDNKNNSIFIAVDKKDFAKIINENSI